MCANRELEGEIREVSLPGHFPGFSRMLVSTFAYLPSISLSILSEFSLNSAQTIMWDTHYMWHCIWGICALEVNQLCESGVGFFYCEVMSLLRTGSFLFGNVWVRNALPAELQPSFQRKTRGGQQPGKHCRQADRCPLNGVFPLRF